MNQYRTYTCNQISLEDVGKKVRIAGFVQTVRDLGGVVFLDIRDMYGITQVVTSGTPEEVDFAAHIPAESSVTVYGEVRKRDEETVNNKIDTGLVEIKIEEIKILGKRTKNLPFEVNTDQEVREDLRLQYRYLDIRNDKIKNNFGHELKEFLYSEIHLNLPKEDKINGFLLENTIQVDDKITLNNEQIQDLFTMTPYYYKTPFEAKERLKKLETLTTQISFVIKVYRKIND